MEKVVGGGKLMEHKLIIKSLRDLDVECTCGKWFIVAPTLDSDKDEEVRKFAEGEFEKHLRRHQNGY